MSDPTAETLRDMLSARMKELGLLTLRPQIEIRVHSIDVMDHVGNEFQDGGPVVRIISRIAQSDREGAFDEPHPDDGPPVYMVNELHLHPKAFGAVAAECNDDTTARSVAEMIVDSVSMDLVDLALEQTRAEAASEG